MRAFRVQLPPENVLVEQGIFYGRTVTRNNWKRFRKVLLWIQFAFTTQCADLEVGRLPIRGVAPPRLNVLGQMMSVYIKSGIFIRKERVFL